MRVQQIYFGAVMSGVLACSPAWCETPPAPKSQLTVKEAIPAQPVAQALSALSKQTGLQIVYMSRVADGLRSPGTPGGLRSEEALRRLLSTTGLDFQFINERTVTVFVTGSAPLEPRTGGMEIGDALSSLRFAALQTEGQAEDDSGGAKEATTADKGKTKKAANGDGVEEMIVQEGRIKPFSDANVDIPRTVNDVQPYYIFDSETIRRSAAFNVEDFLKQRLTMNTIAQSNSQRSNSPGPQGNTSTFNLRGLGTDKTLVLVNGRRIAGLGSDFVGVINLNAQADLNAIPMSAIDRIEVLPSSASGIYGGGALGGVINLILKKDYNGGEFHALYDNTWDTDAPRRTFGANYGIGLGKTHLMLTAQWSDGESLLLQDRRQLFDRGLSTILRNNQSFIYSSTSPFLGVLPNITSASERVNNVTVPDPGVLTIKNGPSLGTRFSHISAGTAPGISTADLSAMLYANRGVWNLDLPRTTQDPTGLLRQDTLTPTTQSFMLSLRRELTDRFDVSMDASRTTNESLTTTRSNLPNQITIPRASPYNPFDSAVRISYPSSSAFTSMLAQGIKTTTDSVSLGVSYKLPYGWAGLGDYTWSRNRANIYYSTFDSTTFFNNITAGLINPFVDLLRYPLSLDNRYLSSVDNHSDSLVKDISLRASGPLIALPWGTPSLTVGLEHRIASAPENRVALIWPLQPASSATWVSYAREQVMDSLYAEASIPLTKQDRFPLLKSLELQVSGRGERYLVDSGTSYYSISAAGVISYSSPTLNGRPYFSKAAYTSSNNTIGLKYQPIAGVTLRASTATAFLPPTPAQLIKNPLPEANPTTVNDPLNNNQPVQVRYISGGNPDLKPQNSKSFNAGLIWEPGIKTLRLNAEYYKIQQFDAIGNLNAQLLVNNASAYPDRITRDASGALSFLDISSLNLYRRESQGWDLSVDYQLQTRVGTFNIHAVESIILNLKTQYSLTQPAYDGVNFPSEGGAAKYKSNLQLSWERRNWTASWAARYFGSYKQSGALGGPSATQTLASNPNAVINSNSVVTQGSDTIPSQMYHDVFVGYAFDAAADRTGGWAGSVLSGVTLQFGVKNVFDKLPPFDVYYDYYISPYGDTRLRSYWLSARKSF